MASYKLIGKDFAPPDLIGKVTGKAKYAEDFRASGMLFAKLLRSPMPHARVRKLDTRGALAMKGVVAVLTADEVPKVEGLQEPMLTNEPLYAGEPILAVAAVDETTAAEAVERIKIDLQPLPFVIDPLETLRPGGPDPRAGGNVGGRELKLQTIKWTARDFAGVEHGRLPTGRPAEEWQYGDLEAGFKQADLVLEESFVTQALSHHSMEPRTAMAYWQNGKLYLHASSQSVSFVVPGVAKLLGIDPSQLVFISENTGGGFGSKGTGYPQWGIPALLAKKTGRPVMMRVSRDEEHAFGRARPGYQGWVKIGFRKDGRITALDLYIIQSNGPYEGFPDFRNSGTAVSLVYQPMAMRWRSVCVLTNTPPRYPQRGPGENQIAAAIEPFIDKAARKLGVDRVAIRRVNAPGHDGKVGPKQGPITSSYLREALDKGAKRFNWAKKQALSGRRKGSKATGVGVGVAFHSAGRTGFDGLVLIKPDGKLYIHNGAGNLGTFSYAATSRTAAEVLGMPWDRCEIVAGNTGKNVPWNSPQVGSNTSYTLTRTNYVAAMDAKKKLQEIAAKALNGTPDDFDVGNGRVFLKADPSKGLSFAEAAQRAIKLGGKYSGQELPKDLNPLTVRAATALAGQGLMGVARDNLPSKGLIPAFCAAFVQVEVDLETGRVEIQECLEVADCGTVLHPKNLGNQLTGGAVQGFGFALTERHIFDSKLGLSATRGLYGQKLPTYLDVPLDIQWDAVNQPDRFNPVGAKGIGEPPLGAAAAAVLCAISDALGGVYFNRSPVTCDMILNAAEGKPQSFKPLEVNV
ncbi:MAG TPA: xanthine dehydrogenase family protein molybdopterin-binding subunit [candidate division Zixibacteria bacterium]|nr:xanthine dehydrogenase family protein molybdopterin-binding subunit [candidate division Zixibacteria bacterium]